MHTPKECFRNDNIILERNIIPEGRRRAVVWEEGGRAVVWEEGGCAVV